MFPMGRERARQVSDENARVCEGLMEGAAHQGGVSPLDTLPSAVAWGLRLAKSCETHPWQIQNKKLWCPACPACTGWAWNGQMLLV